MMDAKICLVALFITLETIVALPAADLKQLEHFLEQYGPIIANEQLSEPAENIKIFDEKAAESAERADRHKHKIEKLKHVTGKVAAIIHLTAEALNQIKHQHQDIFHVLPNLLKKLLELKQADLAEHLLKDENFLRYYALDRYKF